MTIRAGSLLLAALPFVGFGAPVITTHAQEGTLPPEISAIPPRPPDALGGTAFFEQLSKVPAAAQQRAIRAEILKGNVPLFLRRMQPVRLVGVTPARRRVSATVWVLPDYMAIGSDTDFVRVPLDLPTALALASALDLRLPTRKVVDAVYQQAAVRLPPITMRPGPRMRSPGYVLTHNRRIEEARVGKPLGALTAGHKKDLVLTRRLQRRPGRVAIYGWHLAAGRPIQPLSTVHGARYADYSHGVRFVAPTVLIDGAPREYYEVLADKNLSPVLSYEGRIQNARALQDADRGVLEQDAQVDGVSLAQNPSGYTEPAGAQVT